MVDELAARHHYNNLKRRHPGKRWLITTIADPLFDCYKTATTKQVLGYIKYLRIWWNCLKTIPLMRKGETSPTQLVLYDTFWNCCHSTDEPYIQYFTPIGAVLDCFLNVPLSKYTWMPTDKDYGDFILEVSFIANDMTTIRTDSEYLTYSIKGVSSRMPIQPISYIRTVLNLNMIESCWTDLHQDVIRATPDVQQEWIDTFTDILQGVAIYLQLRHDNGIPWTEPIEYFTAQERLLQTLNQAARSGMKCFELDHLSTVRSQNRDERLHEMIEKDRSTKWYKMKKIDEAGYNMNTTLSALTADQWLNVLNETSTTTSSSTWTYESDNATFTYTT